MTKPFQLLRFQAAAGLRSQTLTIRRLNMVFHGDSGYLNVLEDVTFNIADGELVCILGPSGCGKTTLLKLIAGFMKPSGGSMEINGKAITRPGRDRCVVFQEDALFPWLTVAENIAFGIKGLLPGKQVKAEVRRYLEMVGLSAFKDYLPGEISGGMNQRVALARVLILKPQVLLMDEPFGALDAQTREDMQGLLLSLWKALSNTIVFVTHDLGEAILLADRILVMSQNPGRIQSEVPVDLPRPRKKESDEFHLFYRDLRNRL